MSPWEQKISFSRKALERKSKYYLERKAKERKTQEVTVTVQEVSEADGEVSDPENLR